MTVWFRRYFGHSPANQMEQAYLGEQNGLGVKEGTDEFVEKLRVEVVERVDEEISRICQVSTYRVVLPMKVYTMRVALQLIYGCEERRRIQLAGFSYSD